MKNLFSPPDKNRIYLHHIFLIINFSTKGAVTIRFAGMITYLGPPPPLDILNIVDDIYEHDNVEEDTGYDTDGCLVVLIEIY